MLHEYKLVILGNGAVGKSSLTIQFAHNRFVDKYDPTIEDIYRSQVEVEGKTFMLEIIDTAGTEQFTAMRDLYMKNGQGFLLIYSIDSQATFFEIPSLYEQILRVKDAERVPAILVGNKCDLNDRRVITTDDGQELAKKLNIPFFETSAKMKINVREAFNALVKECYKVDKPKRADNEKRKKCTLL